MRTVRLLHLLLVPAATLAAACADSPSMHEPTAGDDPATLEQASARGERSSSVRWADGYLLAHDPLAASYTPATNASYNRVGGAITITKIAGTTGRYLATFSGLSAYLGAGGSTVHVSGSGSGNTYCKPVAAYLVSDKVEVRCFRGATGAAANAAFTLLVNGAGTDRGFAYAHQPTDSGYTPDALGSASPGSVIKVLRFGKGQYQVDFADLRPSGQVPGQAQVVAVGAGPAHCAFGEWGGQPNLYVQVVCRTPAGALVDSKFNVLFTRSAAHLAFALADRPTASSYSPPAYGAINPASGGVTITRNGVGKYSVRWAGADPEILGRGNVQVTAVEEVRAIQCKVTGQGVESAQVQCFGADGSLRDSYYSVLLGS
jgi:hypothetical protein